MKIFTILLLAVSLLFSQNIKKPLSSFKASGSIVDMVYNNGTLYCATAAGSVDIFDYKSKKLIKKIELGKITDFMGDKIDSKVYSVDVLENKILILSQDEQGFRRVHIHQNDKTTLIIDASKALTISKAKFLNTNTILLGLLSNELLSYDIKSAKINAQVQISQAKFSDFALNESKSEVVVADESGDLKIYSTKELKRTKSLLGGNLDNVFQVDYKNAIIATAGQDRKMFIYALKQNSSYFVTSGFLIYSVGVSPNGSYAAYASDEENNVKVINTQTKTPIGIFGGNAMTISKILFIDENEFLVGSDDKVINLYSVK